MKRPRLTDRIIRGLITCTSLAATEMEGTAGDESSPWDAKDRAEAEDADQWVRAMREYRKEKKAARGLLSIDEVNALLTKRNIPAKAFWLHVGGGDMVPVLRKDFERLVAEAAEE